MKIKLAKSDRKARTGDIFIIDGNAKFIVKVWGSEDWIPIGEIPYMVSPEGFLENLHRILARAHHKMGRVRVTSSVYQKLYPEPDWTGYCDDL